MIAAACVVYGVTIAAHECAHAVTGWLVGGHPMFVSTTDVRGEWSDVSRIGLTAIGVSGSVVNWLIAGCMALLISLRSTTRPTTTWVMWLALAVNGFVPAMYMIVSPILGFGDWDTVLSRWPGDIGWRAVVASVGGALTWWWIRVSRNALNTVIGLPASAARTDFVHRLVATSWITGGALAVTAALLSPLDTIWAVGIGLGSSMGTTWPLMPVAQSVSAGHPTRAGGELVNFPRRRGWLVAGMVVAIIFIGVLGRGITLR